jgi:hypothetical protein
MPNESNPTGKSSEQDVGRSAEKRSNKPLPRAAHTESHAPDRVGKAELKRYLTEYVTGEPSGPMPAPLQRIIDSGHLTSERANDDLGGLRETSDSPDAVRSVAEDQEDLL